MGSVNNLYACCSACKGLFDDLDIFASHCMGCGGDVGSSPCVLVACDKVLYLAFLKWKSSAHTEQEGINSKTVANTTTSLGNSVNEMDLKGLKDMKHRRRKQKVAPWRKHLQRSYEQKLSAHQHGGSLSVSPRTLEETPTGGCHVEQPQKYSGSEEPPVKLKPVSDNVESPQITRKFVIRTRRQKLMDSEAQVDSQKAVLTAANNSKQTQRSSNDTDKVDSRVEVVVTSGDNDPRCQSQTNTEEESMETDSMRNDRTTDRDTDRATDAATESREDGIDQADAELFSLEGLNFRESSDQRHGIRYECTLCDYKTKHLGMCQRHCRAHDNSGALKCPECDYQTCFIRLYKRHVDSHTRFQCPHCERSYTRPHDRNRHVKMMHSADPDIFRCSHCQYSTKFKHLLKEHLLKHSDAKIECPFDGCSFTTIYKRSLQVHLWTVHSDVKTLQCDQCPYRAKIMSQLNRHMLRHKADRPYQCPHCDYRASQMSYIRRHLLIHDCVKKYFCDQCNYSCSRTSSLRLHLMSHIGVKPWECSLCDYRSIQRQKITRHINKRHPGPMGGEAVRRNLVLKINANEFKKPSSLQCGILPGELTDEGEDRTTVDLANAKWLVVEPASGTVTSVLPSSNSVEEEVVVGEIPLLDDTAGELSMKGGPTSCLYQCAFCEFVSGFLDEVQDHLKECHPDDGSDEIPMLANIETVTLSAEHADILSSRSVSQQNVTILDGGGDTMNFTCGQEEVMTSLGGGGESEVVVEGVYEGVSEAVMDGLSEAVVEGIPEVVVGEDIAETVVSEAVVEEGVESSLVLEHVTEVEREKELVSTAIESILHLQQVVANINS